MAFMMPVMKKNYNIYGERGRKVSGETVGDGRKASQPTGIPGGARRRVRSEGPASLSTSPAPVGPQDVTGMRIISSKGSSKPVPMRRVRGSAPILAVGGSANSYVLRHNSLPGGPSTAPTGNSPAPVSPTHSTGSTSSSSSDSSTGHHRFHIKLLSRLRKTLRIKDPAPAAS